MVTACILLGVSAFAPPPPAYDTTFVVARGARIVIEHREGDITVMGTSGREARVLLEDEEGDAEVRESGGAYHVKARRTWEEDGELLVWVPEDVHVSIHGIEGDVTVLDVRGNVSVETIEGDIEISGAATVEVTSVDGDVDLTDLRGPVTVALGDGDALLDGVSGDIVVHGIDGDITVLDGDAQLLTLSVVSGDVWYDGVVHEGGEYTLGSHDGDITFSLPEDVGAAISVSTFDGSLRPSFPIQFRGGSVRTSQFTIGDGSAKVALNVFDGDIFLIRPGERSPERN